MRGGEIQRWCGGGMSPQGNAQPRSLSFTIPGRIGGKGRARGVIRGGKVAMFTPGKTKSDEGIVRHFAAQARKGAALMVGPLEMFIEVRRVPPASWPEKRRAAARFITGKPDCDNTLKLIADAMNGLIYQDDSQIASIIMYRTYDLSLQECVRVFVRELEP